MNHYLDNTGMDFWNDPNFLLNEVPVFARTVSAQVSQLAGPAFAQLASSGGWKL